jgi:hypothetical protein
MEKDCDYLNSRYVGTEYGDLRRERAALMKRMIFNDDASVKPRIRELTQIIYEHIKGKK